jgi:hypothetical protein
LGAIVSPPDAVAAKAILQRTPLPGRLVTTLEGESLVNNASGLLLYQIAILCASTANITLVRGGNLFISLTAIGIAVGALSLLIRLIRIRPVGRQTMSELEARSKTFNAALQALSTRKAGSENVDDMALRRLLDEYKVRVSNNERAHHEGAEQADARARQLRLELDMVSVSRRELLELKDAGRIDDVVLHRIEAELDFEEMRLLRLLEP